MMRSNLLPARAARRRVELRRQLQVAIAVVLVASGTAIWGYVAQQGSLEAQAQAVARIQQEVKRLEALLQEVQKSETTKAILDKKVGALEEIKTAQRRPARWLADISRSLPDHMWLVSIKDTSAGVQISGRSF